MQSKQTQLTTLPSSSAPSIYSKNASSKNSIISLGTSLEHTPTIDPFFPDRTMYIQLFTNVSNAQEIKQKILPNLQEENSSLKGCFFVFVNPHMVAGIGHLVNAMNITLFKQASKQLKTKNLQNEFLYSLSADRNITESLKLFGINEFLTELLLVIVDTSTQQRLDLYNRIKGDPTHIENLRELKDTDLIKQHLNISVDILDQTSFPNALESAFIARIATKEL